MKVVKTAKIEQKKWHQEMNRFLRNYRATPHSTMRVPPATMLFGRPIKTKLPKIEPTKSEESDQEAKAKMKKHADSKAYVQPSSIKESDAVFVKRDDSKSGDTPHKPRPYVVEQKKGSMVTATNNSESITRNSSWFKKAPSSTHDNNDDDDDIDDAPPPDSTAKPAAH